MAHFKYRFVQTILKRDQDKKVAAYVHITFKMLLGNLDKMRLFTLPKRYTNQRRICTIKSTAVSKQAVLTEDKTGGLLKRLPVRQKCTE